MNRLRSLHFAAFLGIILSAALAHAQKPFGLNPLENAAPTATHEVLKIQTFWSADAARPGDAITLAVELDIQHPWHLNAHNAQSPFIATRIELRDPPTMIQASTAVYPTSKPLSFGSGPDALNVPVFSGKITILLPMRVGENAGPGEIPLTLTLRVQSCDDKTCLPPETIEQALALTVVPAGSVVTPNQNPVFQMDSSSEVLAIPFFGVDFTIDPTQLWLLWIVAIAGGLLLNFTPCVLPVIPIKIMSLAKAAENRRRCMVLGLAMSSGVVIFWLGLGAAIAFVSEFTSANQLFQYPAFTISVGVVIAAMAVGMCGLFTVQLPQWVYKINPKQDSLHGSFGFGVMTAILSTPCTAPFMGAAAAWAATRHPAVTLSTFAAIGAGMALPYFLLSLFPNLVNRVPRTGPGSELLKQMMGLLMLAAAAYFIGTGLSGILVNPPDPPSRFYWWVVSGLIAVAGLWLIVQSVRLFPQKFKRIALIALGILITGPGLMLGNRLTAHGPIDWVYYTPERLAIAQESQKAVVLEFTAEWCLNCHALEQAVLHNPRIVKLLAHEQVVPIKVDLTGNNTDGNQKLVDIGNRTIPLLVVYDRQGREVFRSDAYTVDQLAKAIQKAIDLK